MVIGFNKIHGLDVYFAADPCYKAKVMEEKGALYRIGPRYRTYLALEDAVFDPSSHARILLIAEAEKTKYIKYYKTSEERFYNLPPGISEDRIITGDAGTIRKAVRVELGMNDDEIFLLMVGSGFKTKGLDRSLAALSGLPDSIRARAKLFVIGEGNVNPFKTLARRLKVHDRLVFLGGRNDVPRFMASADLLLHPAYSENTGTVLIEAMAAGLPILAADICGYAFHVIRAGAGLLIPSPYQQRAFDELLLRMLTSPDREAWKRKGPEYVKENDFVSMPEKAADLIESFGPKGSKK
jgi:UDP-glucose:(heptosyl)LPS alpha-1,3-glucosyltransferase